MTKMFRKYAIELVIRGCLFAYAIFLLFTDSSSLDVAERFGFHDGIDFVDIAFILLFLDMMRKLIPSAKIAIGSKKQWGIFHKPTASTVDEQVMSTLEHIEDDGDDNISQCYQGTDDIPTCQNCSAACPHRPDDEHQKLFSFPISDSDIEWIRSLPKQIASPIEELFQEHIARPVTESAKGAQELSRQVARQLSTLSGKEMDESLLESDEKMRESIRQNRVREIVPVVVFWILFNSLIAMILIYLDFLNPIICLVWTLFYFLSDLVCVVAWCPFQVLLMRNRCCTTCQIFNWDAIMAATPLLFAPCLFSWILIGLALIVLLRWEIAFLRNPERFDERTNGSLLCANCQDKLCVIRRPLRNIRNGEPE